MNVKTKELEKLGKTRTALLRGMPSPMFLASVRKRLSPKRLDEIFVRLFAKSVRK